MSNPTKSPGGATSGLPWRLLLPLLFLPGCGRPSAEKVQLILISPHRDEIREEVELGFRDWFCDRCAGRVSDARAALARWAEHKSADQTQPVENAIERLLGDWSADEAPGIRRELEAWKRSPNESTFKQLLLALDSWRENVPEVQFIWQDMGGTSQIARYITARFESNPEGIGVDVLFGGGTDIFLRFAGQGLLQRTILPPGVLEGRIPKQLNGIPIYDAEYRWFGPVLSSFGILCNREVLRRIDQPEPKHWADLGSPGLFGWVSSADPRTTGSIHMVYEIILQGKGWDEGFSLLLRLGANTHTFIRDSGTLTRTVSGGEVAAAGNLDANALSAVGRDPLGMAFNLPDGETIINPDAFAILKGAPHFELARAFVEYSLSDEGQMIYLLQPGQPGGPRRFPLCRLSVVEKLYERFPAEVRSVGDANPFKVKNTIAYNSTLGNNRWDGVNDLFGAVILDAHPDMRRSVR